MASTDKTPQPETPTAFELYEHNKKLELLLREAEARERELTEAARNARAVAAALDYDEQAIKDALWALVDAVLNSEERP